MRSAPLFLEDALPFQRPRIAGFTRGDRVEIPDPKSQSLARRGTVSATFPHFNEVMILCDNGVITLIAPERVRKVTA